MVLSNYFKKIHDLSMFIQAFSDSMIFPYMELFFLISRFSMISRARGNPEMLTVDYKCGTQLVRYIGARFIGARFIGALV